MGMNMSEKILAKHAGLPEVHPGQLITCHLDMVLANDITAPPSIAKFEEIGRPVFDPEKIALVPDHFQPAKDIKSAGLAKIVRDFAHKHKIVNYFEQGRVGIEHVILPEKGLVGPGMLTIGADSHTCTYGAVNGFSTGVGSTDLGMAMATGKAWFKVPEAINVHLTGKKPANITGKDVILTLIGKIGVDGALYQSLEFTGEGVAELSMTDRLTIANMAIEAGAKNGIELKIKARVTVRANIDRLVGGAGEPTIIARVGEGIVTTVGSSERHNDVLANPDDISKTVLGKGLDAGTAFEILSIDIADVDVGRNIGAELQTDQAEADKRIAQAKAEERRAMAVAKEQEMKAYTQEMEARVVEAQAEVPHALAQALREGKLGVMDYYNLNNVQADTEMRNAISQAGAEKLAPQPPAVK